MSMVICMRSLKTIQNEILKPNNIGVSIARVFPTKTSMCPDDEHCYFGEPSDSTPMYDEVHVSVTFTWNIKKGWDLVDKWKSKARLVKIGGPAINGESTQPFVPGMYLKKGVTISSRGCPNKCSFCLVKNNLVEFDSIPEGNIVQDNNILACSGHHWEHLLKMLKNQKQIEFKGGLESRRITPKIVADLSNLKIKSIWLACDNDSDLKSLKHAVDLLKEGGFKQYKIFCYVLIGKEEQRLREVFDMGCMPFAQLYQPPTKYKYTKQMKQYQRTWCRPAAYKTVMKDLRRVK